MTALVISPRTAFRDTSAVSAQGRTFSLTTARGKPVRVDSSVPAPSVEQQLYDVLVQAKESVRSSVRDLGPVHATTFIAQLSSLFDPEEWDEEDAIPKVASIQTMIRSIIALGCAPGGLTLTESGHLVSTWTDASRTARVEALPSGKVTWAVLDRNGEDLTTSHKMADTIASLCASLQG